MDDRLSRIETKVDKLLEDAVRNTAVLEVHVKRTDLLEKIMRGVLRRIHMGEGAVALVGLLALVATILVLFKR